MQEHKKPILYIAGPGYSYEHFEPLLASIFTHFDEILKSLLVRSPSGNTTAIELFIEATSHEEVYAKARRVSKEESAYEVRLSAGLSYHIWLASRAILANYEFFDWLERCRLTSKDARKKGRKAILSDYAYFLSSYYVLLHEIAHIVLGHCDFIEENMMLGALEEFDGCENLKDGSWVRIRKAFEAEADRQAGVWLFSFFDSALGASGKGVDIIFPSRKEVYQFYAYAVTTILVLFQQLSQRADHLHPLPNQRQSIVILAALSFFEKYKPLEKDEYLRNSIINMQMASEAFGLIGAGSLIDICKNAIDMAFVDEVIQETQIRTYQHTVLPVKGK